MKEIKSLLFYLIFVNFILVFNLYSQNNDSTKVDSLNIHYTASNINSIERKLIDDELKINKGWRLAATADNKNESLKDYLKKNPGYQPYYIKYDMNNDGLDDFAAAVINNEKFGVIVFFGNKEGFSKPQWLFKNRDLSLDGLFKMDEGLCIGSCFDCGDVVYYKWDKRKGKLILVQ